MSADATGAFYEGENEIFDPLTNLTTLVSDKTLGGTAGLMTHKSPVTSQPFEIGRYGHLAIKRADGKVMIIGGHGIESHDAKTDAPVYSELTSVFVFDPTKNVFIETSPLATARRDAMGALLADSADPRLRRPQHDLGHAQLERDLQPQDGQVDRGSDHEGRHLRRGDGSVLGRAAGPGWIILGSLKLLAGSFLAFFALNHGVSHEHAAEPAQMYLEAFRYVLSEPDLALALTGTFVILSQVKINVTNAYAGSIAWSNFFSRLTHSHPGRVVWLVFNVWSRCS